MHKRLWVRGKRLLVDIGPAAFAYTFIYYWAAGVKHHNQIAERD
jgi:hypothetical protein